MLASPAVRLTGAFDAHFADAGLTAVWPNDGRALDLIRRVKRGEVGMDSYAEMARLASEMAGKSDHLLVACTELSLLTASLTTPFTDSLDCLVQAILDFARG